MHFNTEIEQKKAYTMFRTAIVCINFDLGVSDWEILDHAVRKEDFLEFLQRLRLKYKSRSITMFHDNLSAVRTNYVKDNLDELDIRIVFNLSNSPQFQPIEGVFSESKSYFKKKKLKTLAAGNDFDIDATIAESLARVPIEHV